MKLNGAFMVVGILLALVQSQSGQTPALPGLPSTNMEFALIPAGEFLMGCAEKDCPGQKTAHEVRITRDFELGRFLVTQEQWTSVMGRYKGIPFGAKFPALVNWNDAQQFAKHLTSHKPKGYTIAEHIAGFANKFFKHSRSNTRTYRYRLPTDAEWEYAARAGGASLVPGSSVELRSDAPVSAQSGGDWIEISRSEDGQWILPCGDGAGMKPCPIFPRSPNPWQLYELLSGEWVQDWYGAYFEGRVSDPTGPAKGTQRVVRGDIYHTFSLGPPRSVVQLRPPRVDARTAFSPDTEELFGFRIVREKIE